MEGNERIEETRHALRSVITTRFNPVVVELDALYDAKEIERVRSMLSELEDSLFSTDAHVIDDAFSSLRVVSSGRSVIHSLFDSHNFDAALDIDKASNDDELIERIRYWNPPSVKTATRFSTDYASAAESLDDLTRPLDGALSTVDAIENGEESDTKLSEHEVADQAEIIQSLQTEAPRLSDALKELSDLCMGLVADRDAIRSAKSEYLTATGARKRKDKSNALEGVIRALTSLRDSLEVRLRGVEWGFTNAPFRSKKKLLDAQKEWNASIREARDSATRNQRDLLAALGRVDDVQESDEPNAYIKEILSDGERAVNQLVEIAEFINNQALPRLTTGAAIDQGDARDRARRVTTDIDRVREEWVSACSQVESQLSK